MSDRQGSLTAAGGELHMHPDLPETVGMRFWDMSRNTFFVTLFEEE